MIQFKTKLVLKVLPKISDKNYLKNNPLPYNHFLIWSQISAEKTFCSLKAKTYTLKSVLFQTEARKCTQWEKMVHHLYNFLYSLNFHRFRRTLCPMLAFSFDSKQKALDGDDARNRRGVPARPVFFLSFFSGCISKFDFSVSARHALVFYIFNICHRHFDTLKAGVGRGVRLNRNSKQPAHHSLSRSVSHSFGRSMCHGVCIYSLSGARVCV